MTVQDHPRVQAAGTAVRGRPPVDRADMPANTRRGGDIRVLLSPTSVGSAAGFLGTLHLAPGDVLTEHWHPYSEEFVYCTTGSAIITLDGVDHPVHAEQAVHVPIGVRHRIVNTSTEPTAFVFVCGPLAPRPELGHVDTELAPGAPRDRG